MQREGFRVTAEFEASHWWFRARRELFMAQAERAAEALGEIGRPLRILDYGCGTGFNLTELSRLGEVSGADVPNAEAIEFRRESRFPWLDLSTDLSGYHGRFDVVTALDVLEHLEDDVAGLAQIGRFLRPGGQLVMTVPAYAWLWSGEDVISQHRRRYTRPQLARVCSQSGLEIHFLSYFNAAILPGMAAIVWLRRLLSRDDPPRSNLSPTPAVLNDLLRRITAAEARRVGAERWRLPAGASLVCRCRLPGHEPRITS